MHKDLTCPFRHVSRWFREPHLRSLMFFRFYSVWPWVFPKIQAYSEHRKMRQYVTGIGKPATLGCHEQTVPQSWKQFQELNFWEESSQVRMGTVRDQCLRRSRVCCRDVGINGSLEAEGRRESDPNTGQGTAAPVFSHAGTSMWGFSRFTPSPQLLYFVPPRYSSSYWGQCLTFHL